MVISIIGLGYVGLPLAIELSKKFKVKGYDHDITRIKELNLGKDKNLQYKAKQFTKLKNLNFTNNFLDLAISKVFIITVPTPIDKNKKPDLTLIINASNLISSVIKKNSIVILESTVYPGVTRNIVGKIIEKKSKLKLYEDFNLAYSPERINPGDKKNNLINIRKIVGASDKKTLMKVSKIYNSFLKKDIYQTDNIEIAEAAKVIENTQRDVNIALINEFNKIFNNMKIDTNKILDAACTKWNFLNFRPGLVGGHCIGIDPYYLAHSAHQFGIKPNLILSGRKINEEVPKLIVNKCVKLLDRKNFNVLFLGLTFKENCPDFRNSKSFKVLNLLNKYTNKIDIYDPYMDTLTKKKLNKKNVVLKDLNLAYESYDLIMILVSHQEFKIFSKNYKFEKLLKSNGYIYDFKNILREHKKIIKV